MAIKANMTTHDGIALTQAYCIVRNAKVAKNQDDSFELVYEVQIYATAAKSSWLYCTNLSNLEFITPSI